jgi:hypothetical protein
MAYFQAVQARWRRYSMKSVSVPRDLEAAPRFIEARSVAGAGSATVVYRIETDITSPLLRMDRRARLNRNRADLNVT